MKLLLILTLFIPSIVYSSENNKQHVVEKVPLTYVKVGQVLPLLDKIYTTKNGKIIADVQSNSLIVSGDITVVDSLKLFIEKHIDVQSKSEDVILHLYPTNPYK